MTENEKAELIQPLRDIVNSDEFKSIADQLAAIQFNYIAEMSVFPHVSGIITTMNGLKTEVTRWPVHVDETSLLPPPTPESE